MPNTEISFNELPSKAHLKIFQGLTQDDRIKNRRVCKDWNRIVVEEFPVELTITNDNYARLFLCPHAQKVTINNLTEEFTGKVAFAGTIRSLEVTGKVLSSNLTRILQGCQNLETLLFSSLKQVLEIESNEVIGLPRVTTLEIKVRPDQETFTSDEMIIISTLRKIQFGSLESIVISVLSSMYWDEEDDDDDDLARSSQGFALNESSDDIELLAIDAESNEPSTEVVRLPNYPSLESQENPDTLNIRVAEPHQPNLSSDEQPETTEEPMIVDVSNSDYSTASDRLTEQPAGIDSSTSDSMNSIPSMNDSEFAGRVFRARLMMQLQNSDVDLDSFLNDPSGSELRSNRMHNNTNRVNLRATVFFELMRNNSKTLKSFIVKTRPDFMCFGNLSPFATEVSKIQLEEVEYSFGRSQLCLEYMLLRVQSKLHRIRVHILDDIWSHLMMALEKSHETITEVDLKILSLSEDPIDLITLSRCKDLKILKLLHFFEKQSLNCLPNSLTKLILNGPIAVEDLLSFTSRLINLVEFTLILNNTGGKVDINLFKLFVTMPKLSKLALIQCLLDVDAISDYCENTTGLVLKRELMSIPSIQYIMILINPDFDRQLVTNS